MKYLLSILLLAASLVACDSGSDGPVAPPSGLDGLWSATTAIGYGQSQRVPAGEIYLHIENTSSNPITAQFYAKDDLNCLEASPPGSLTHYGNNRFKDQAGDVATLTVNGNTLTMGMTVDGDNLQIKFDKTVGITTADLPVCGRGAEDNNLQNDYAPAGFQTLVPAIQALIN